MEPTFTTATLFWLFVPMPLLIVFSLVSLLAQIRKEKKRKNLLPNLNRVQENLTNERGES
ncbi:hypothetical protein CR203_24435 [Salipaludibacillus neizhouensis]|uniref:Uncharacterized protein n=1 Tax=Salipaludibacillus neizhouensis TaxID=885475 RepID=A0A3A9JV17_9BACI|nr:hypothetical protein [Salipaludibacillus neizhouensis]RKL64774.1 hypothetical protein CR203_24435 [Salipaludibacillus neizhouensis]